MKKLILIIIFFINVSPHIKNGQVYIHAGQQIVAQSIPCPCSNPPCGSSFWNNMGTFFSNLGKAIGGFFSTIGGAIGDFFSNQPGGGEEFSSEAPEFDWEPEPWLQQSGYSGVGGPYDPWDDPYYQNLFDYYNTYGGSGTPPDIDCYGVVQGKAFVDRCGKCVGGTTGLQPCRLDSVKPNQINCDSLALARGNTLTKIVDSLDKLAVMQNLRNGVHDSTEKALSAYDSAGNYKIFDTSVTTSYGSSSVTTWDTTTGANHKNINFMGHTHTDSANALPDNNDIYMLIFRRMGIFMQKNRFFNHSVIVSGQIKTDLGITISDTMAALAFINRYPRDSAIAWMDTLFTATGYSLLNPWWSNFKSFYAPADSVSLRREFDDAVNLLKLNNYPEELLWTYAQVYMINRYNMGVRISMKVNGVFKELSPNISRNSSGQLTDLKMDICL